MNRQIRLTFYMMTLLIGVKLLVSCSTTLHPESPPQQEQA